MTLIEGTIFSGCKGLENVEIPNTVVTIGDEAFRECKAKIGIPNSVTEIGDRAFIFGNVTIYCKSDSIAKQYAENKYINYRIDDDFPIITELKQEDTYIIVQATDNEGIGLASKSYSLDGQIWQEDNKLMIKESGKYTVYVKDKLGNVASKEINVTIGEKKEEEEKQTENKTEDNKKEEINDKDIKAEDTKKDEIVDIQ